MIGTNNYTSRGVLALGMVLATGFIGFVDDISKVMNTRSLGLRARYKLVWLLGITLLFGYFFISNVSISSTIAIPFSQTSVDLGWLYLPFLFVIIAGATNSVNLTDGLDGLASGTAAIVMMAFAGIAFRQGRLDLAIFAAAVAGGCVGFLWFNSNPASIFMGDTGSFALGGAIAAMAILTKTELFLAIIGGIYVIEAVSVILQVFIFRYFKKRIFKMAPIHHHFEILGWSETTIMVRFWIVSGLLSGLGFALYFMSIPKGA
jgi:phospho-N-acetylmuramoyl-pentapeptide-transferase